MARQKSCQGNRHVPAFILLVLAEEQGYGASILSTLQKKMPHCQADSAAIYRALQELEREGAVESFWETEVSGPARKWYKITDTGRMKLEEFKEDIERRIQNLQYFLDTYEKLDN